MDVGAHTPQFDACGHASFELLVSPGCIAAQRLDFEVESVVEDPGCILYRAEISATRLIDWLKQVRDCRCLLVGKLDFHCLKLLQIEVLPGECPVD